MDGSDGGWVRRVRRDADDRSRRANPLGRRCGLRFALAVLVLGCCSVTSVSASERSEKNVSQGLVEFYDGELMSARRSFESAVAADPDDATAHYYLGLSNARLENLSRAAADFEKALELRPDMAQAAMELGYVLYRMGRYGDAVRWLERAQASEEFDARASFFLGLAELRRERDAAAEIALERAATRDPSLVVPVRFYRGVLAYRGRDLSRATENFRYVRDTAPESNMAEEAGAYLDRITEGRAAPRNYALYGAVGFEYDSNVPLLASKGSIRSAQKALSGIDDESDGVSTLTVGGWYLPYQSDKVQVATGYELFQSLHFDLNDFNVQNHRVRAGVSVDEGNIEYGFTGRYDFYLRETDSFLHETNALPWLRIPTEYFGDTEFYYRLRYRHYDQSSLDGLLDGFNQAVGIVQSYAFGAGGAYVSLGYRFEHEGAAEKSRNNAFAYDGHQLQADCGWDLPYAIAAEVAYAYEHQDYDGSSNGREDDQHWVSFTLARPINPWLAVTTGYYGEFNQSNKNEFQYERHVGLVSLDARY